MKNETEKNFYKHLGRQISVKHDFAKIFTLYGLTEKIPSLKSDIFDKRTLYNYKNAITKISLYNLIAFLKEYGEKEIELNFEGSKWVVRKEN